MYELTLAFCLVSGNCYHMPFVDASIGKPVIVRFATIDECLARGRQVGPGIAAKHEGWEFAGSACKEIEK